MGKNELLPDLEKENVSLKKALRYISHELLNVLTLVDYSIKAVDGTVNEVKGNQYWNYIINDIDYMVNLLRELSNYNHCSELNRERCSVSEWVYYISKEMKQKYENEINVMTCIKGSHEMFCADIDRSKIRQVIVNLVKNAAEALNGVENPIIVICVKKDKKWIKIEVMDNGCGIDEESQKIIFDEGVTFGKKDGSGLGLSISKRIIESHGGTIELKSSPGDGTIFTIKLPAN
ncbi:MAG: sensor histidine kinase [Lachnospiraceae bacterium]